jgi:2'-5' RNA ligase
MSRGPASARLFVAVDPPEQVAEELAVWARSAARELRSHPHGAQRSMRVLDADLLHVTICFLGDRAIDEIPSLAGELAACEHPEVQLSVGAPLWLPPRRPRALAVELHDEGGALARMQAEVTARLDPTDGEAYDRSPARPGGRMRQRRFHPHITVARMRPDTGRRSRGSLGEHIQPSLQPTPPLSFAPPELVLYRSWLSPEGARYEALSAFALG